MTVTQAAQPVPLMTPRVVKCPTPQCPGWITLDSTRHQTEPCRYCRVGVDTLRFLLSRVGAENKALPAQIHEEFNRLMLTMAGAWGQNVYLRPSRETLVDLKSGARGVTIEYNPLLGAAGSDGAAPLVGIILHKLLHFEAHLGQKPPQISPKSGAREREALLPLLQYIFTVADHAWVTARLQALNPLLHSAQSLWGLDMAQMLVGSESMFNRYLSGRNLNRLVAELKSSETSDTFLGVVIDRLATLTSQTLDREREETHRIYLGIQIANARLMNPDAVGAYQGALEANKIANVSEAAALAERVYGELRELASPAPSLSRKKEEETAAVSMDAGQYHRALDGALKVLGLANYFEVKG